MSFLILGGVDSGGDGGGRGSCAGDWPVAMPFPPRFQWKRKGPCGLRAFVLARAMYSEAAAGRARKLGSADRQTSPAFPCLAMKLLMGRRASPSALRGMTRIALVLPRSSASTRMIMRPLRRSSMISSIGEQEAPLPSRRIRLAFKPVLHR